MVERHSWSDVRAARAEQDPNFEWNAARARVRFDLGQLVYDLRRRSGLTQAALAERMGTTQSAVARLEGGGTNPTIEMLQRLGEAMGVRLALVVEGVDAPDTVLLSGARGDSTAQ